MSMNFHSIARTIDQRRTFVDSVAEGSGGVTRFTAFATVNDTGEVIIPVTFPCVFTEKPVFWWGAEMDPGSVVADGGYPMVCAIVRNFLSTRNEVGGEFYTGASIVVILSGVDTQTMTIGCHFEGRALRGNF